MAARRPHGRQTSRGRRFRVPRSCRPQHEFTGSTSDRPAEQQICRIGGGHRLHPQRLVGAEVGERERGIVPGLCSIQSVKTTETWPSVDLVAPETRRLRRPRPTLKQAAAGCLGAVACLSSIRVPRDLTHLGCAVQSACDEDTEVQKENIIGLKETNARQQKGRSHTHRRPPCKPHQASEGMNI